KYHYRHFNNNSGIGWGGAGIYGFAKEERTYNSWVMSLMTEKKARDILKEYMDAELSGDDALADELEDKLNAAGWKISVGPEGYTVIRENGGLFSSDTTGGGGTNVMLPNEQYVTPYSGTQKSTSSNLPLIIGISIGAVLLIVAVIIGIKA